MFVRPPFLVGPDETAMRLDVCSAPAWLIVPKGEEKAAWRWLCEESLSRDRTYRIHFDHARDGAMVVERQPQEECASGQAEGEEAQ